MGKQWNASGEVVTIELKDEDFKNGVIYYGKTYGKEMVKKMFTQGATTKDEETAFKGILHTLYKDKI